MAKKATNYKKILFPTNITEASCGALKHAITLARQFKAQLYVVHVLNTKAEAKGFYVPHLSFEKLDAEMMQRAEEMLDKFTSKKAGTFKAYETTVLKGEPYKQILKFAKDKGMDMIVMRTFSRGSMDRFIFGSTTERVMRLAKCPVLIVPPSR